MIERLGFTLQSQTRYMNSEGNCGLRVCYSGLGDEELEAEVEVHSSHLLGLVADDDMAELDALEIDLEDDGDVSIDEV